MTPRPATERLVEQVLAHVGARTARIVDVRTGSGAIAVAIAAAAPNVHVSATDTSDAAVELARENVRRNGLEDQVTVYHGDLLAPVPEPIDVVVANLPYLAGRDVGLYPDLGGNPRRRCSRKATGSSRTGGCSRPARSGLPTTARSFSSFIAAWSEVPGPDSPTFARRSSAAKRSCVPIWPPETPRWRLAHQRLHSLRGSEDGRVVEEVRRRVAKLVHGPVQLVGAGCGVERVPERDLVAHE